MDETGTIVACNQHWKQFALENGLADPAFGVGTNYITLCQSVASPPKDIETARKVASGLNAILSRNAESFRIEYDCHSPARRRWFIALAVPLAGRHRRAAVLHVEVTDRREAEEALRRAHDELEQRVKERTRELRHEIAQRYQAEIALRASEERYRAIVEDQTDLVCRFLPDTTLIFANPACAAYFGTTPQSILGRTILDLIPPDGHATLRAHLAKLRPDTPVARREWRSQAPDGQPRWHIWTTRAFFDAAGRPVEYQGVGTDISELKRTEQALEQAKAEAEAASRAKTQFLAAASHDLRQPLQTIGTVRGILSRLVTDQDAKRHLRSLGEAHRSMTILLDTLLDVNQLAVGMTAPQRTDFPVAELIDLLTGEFEPIARAKKLGFRVVRSGLTVRSNFGFLKQLTQNLVSNAVRYTKAGKILIGCRRRGDHARIEVWDTGIGIPADQLASIFEEFYQVGNLARQRGKGFGLGLAIAKRMADLLGHPITVRSTPGKGSVFMLDLPLGRLEPPAPTPSPAAAREPVESGRALLLLIEDDTAVLDSLSTLLRLEGFRIMSATSGPDALDRIAAASETPAAIVADYRLPGGETGVEAIRRARERLGRDVPGVILTGEILRTQHQDIENAGFPVLRKPTMPEELFAVIRRVLERAS